MKFIFLILFLFLLILIYIEVWNNLIKIKKEPVNVEIITKKMVITTLKGQKNQNKM